MAGDDVKGELRWSEPEERLGEAVIGVDGWWPSLCLQQLHLQPPLSNPLFHLRRQFINQSNHCLCQTQTMKEIGRGRTFGAFANLKLTSSRNSCLLSMAKCEEPDVVGSNWESLCFHRSLQSASKVHPSEGFPPPLVWVSYKVRPADDVRWPFGVWLTLTVWHLIPFHVSGLRWARGERGERRRGGLWCRGWRWEGELASGLFLGRSVSGQLSGFHWLSHCQRHKQQNKWVIIQCKVECHACANHYTKQTIHCWCLRPKKCTVDPLAKSCWCEDKAICQGLRNFGWFSGGCPQIPDCGPSSAIIGDWGPMAVK